MPMPKQPSHFLSFLLLLKLFHLSHGDVGTAAHYSPPYLPTACYGNDASQFPSSFLFAAASEPIWDSGTSCGRQFLVRCISASVPGTCRDQTIQVKIIDQAQTSVSRPSSSGATVVLCTTAFGSIVDGSASLVNIEYQQV